jgi:hypothetical protein
MALAVALLMTATAPERASRAGGDDDLPDRNSVEALMDAYYGHVTPPGEDKPGPLDKMAIERYSVTVMDRMVLLPTIKFNEVAVAMMVEYRQHPEHRAAIEGLVSALDVETKSPSDKGADAVRAKVREEIRGNPTHAFIRTVIDRAAMGVGVAFVLQGGRSLWKGFWRTAEYESGVMARMRTIVRYTSNSLYRGKLQRWAVGAGVGSAVGLAEATMQALETHKEDPARLLSSMQDEIVHDLAEKAAKMRDEIRSMSKEDDSSLKSHADAYRRRLTEMDNDVTAINGEMKHLFASISAADKRKAMSFVAKDLTEVRNKVAALGPRLDRFGTEGGLP